MASVLTINGATVNRTAGRIVLNQVMQSMDGPSSLTFTERATRTPGTYRQGQPVTLVVDGTLTFAGVIVSLHPSGIGSGPIDVGYRCLDLTWLANLIPITASDGTGRIVYNLPSTDDDYIPSLSGLSVGAILKRLYDLHQPQLSAAGITGYSSAELAALTVVPPEPVILTGRLWTSVLELLSTWHNKYGAWIDASGLIHHPNLLTLPTITLTLDSDPVTLGNVSEDFSDCYTQAVLRGGAWIEAAYLSLADGMIAARWTAADQAAWSYSSFVSPKGGYELGTISAMSSTTLSVTSTSPATITYGANYWSSLNAEVVAYTTTGSSVATIGFCDNRRVTANTAPSSNSYTLTVDSAFSNSGYNHYSIRALAAASSLVWRAFDVVPTFVGQHLVKRFSHSVPWSPTDSLVVQTTSPQAVVCWSQGGISIEWPVTFSIVPSDGAVTCTTVATCTANVTAGAVSGFSGLSGGAGYPASSSTIPVTITGGGGSGALAHATSDSSGVITSVTLDAGGSGFTSSPRVTIGSSPGYLVFDQPICVPYSSQAALAAGGSAIAPPADIKVLVPYSRGAISVTAPSGGGYQGTANSVNGVQRTLYLDYPQWLDYRDRASYQTLAQEKLDCVKNTVVEGPLTYWGKLSSVLTLGKALNIGGNGYTTGYESIAAPIRTVVLDYLPDGGPVQWVTQLSFSTRMKPFAGDRLYAHPNWGGRGDGLGGALARSIPPQLGGGGMAAAALTYGEGMDEASGDGGFGWNDLDQLDGRGGEGGGRSRRRRRRPGRVDPAMAHASRLVDEEMRRVEASARRKAQAARRVDPATSEMRRLAVRGVAGDGADAPADVDAGLQDLSFDGPSRSPDQVRRDRAANRRRKTDLDQVDNARRSAARQAQRSRDRHRAQPAELASDLSDSEGLDG